MAPMSDPIICYQTARCFESAKWLCDTHHRIRWHRHRRRQQKRRLRRALTLVAVSLSKIRLGQWAYSKDGSTPCSISLYSSLGEPRTARPAVDDISNAELGARARAFGSYAVHRLSLGSLIVCCLASTLSDNRVV